MNLRKFFETNSDKTEHFINYFTPDGTDILFRVTPEHLNILDINLHYFILMKPKVFTSNLEPMVSKLNSFFGLLKS